MLAWEMRIRTHVHWIDKVALHASYMCDGEVRDGSVVKVHLAFDHATGDVRLCYHVRMR